MADFPGVHPPVRSVSLPTRLQPESLKVVSELKQLKSYRGSCTARAIQEKMASLATIFVWVREMLSSPLTQKAFAKPRSGELVDGALDESITLIDACGHARDLLSTLREQVRQIRSSLRRSGGGANFSCVERQIKSFICFRKKAKKEAAKHVRELKKAGDSISSPSAEEADSSHLAIVIQVLKDVNDISGSVVKALLESLSTTKVSPKSIGGWSLVSRLMLASHSHSLEERVGWLTEVESVDSTLCSILRSKNDTDSDIKTTQKRLEDLECCILGFEEGLDSLFKCLIQYRVSLLNVLTFWEFDGPCLVPLWRIESLYEIPVDQIFPYGMPISHIFWVLGSWPRSDLGL